jgi:transposase
VKVLHPRCAGLDVHKDVIVACRRIAEGSRVARDLDRFPTTTKGLLRLAAWLEEAGCAHAVLEATGIYWKPVWHVLESRVQLVLVNAAHFRNVPGRKSDMNDATWLADLLAHGLVRSSFVPPTPIQELRDLTRTRQQLTREIVQHTQRIQKVLESANIKLQSAISNVLGVSGRRILNALVEGETDPEKLADLGSDRLRSSRSELVEALDGFVTEHHRFLLRQHVRMVEQLEQTLAEFDRQIEKVVQPFRVEFERLTTIPGISRKSAEILLAEVGVDMERFPTAAHLVSWAGLCPRLDESAGKSRSRRLRKGAPWLKPVLVQCGWAAGRAKGTYLQSQFLRIKTRRGLKRASIAVAASILTSAYHMLKRAMNYADLGPEHLTRSDASRQARRLARRLRDLGYEVRLPFAPAQV